MTKAEAQEILQAIKHYLTAGNPVWDVDEIAEACDMGIEALRNEINCVKCVHYTERETYTGIKGVCKMDTAHREDLIRRSDAIDLWWHDEVFFGNQRDDMTKEQWLDYITDVIGSLPSAEPKTGKWVPVTRVYTTTENDFPYTRCEYVDATEPDEIDAVRCSECGEVFDFHDARNWCTQCGAYMRGKQDD